MSRLNRRLVAVEGRVALRHTEMPGVLEIHLTRAWPACADSGYAKCDEHPETCGVSFHTFHTPGRHMIIRGVPWLGV